MRGPDLLASDDMRFLRDWPHRSSRGEAGKASAPVTTRMTGTRKPRSGLVLVPVPAAPATTPPTAAVPIAATPVMATPVAATVPVVAAMPVAARRKVGRVDRARARFGGVRFVNPGLLRLRLVRLPLLAGRLGALTFVRFVERLCLG